MEEARRLQILRKSTVWFIEQDSTTITLKKSSTVSQGPGGGTIRINGVTRAPQQVKLINRGDGPSSNGEGGQTKKIGYVVVFPYDGEVEVHDSFFVGQNKFVVTDVEATNGYEIKAYATQYGKNPTDG